MVWGSAMELLLKMIVSRTGNNKYKLIKYVFIVVFFKNNNSISTIEYCVCKILEMKILLVFLFNVLLTMETKELTHIPYYLISLFEVEMSTSLRLQFL
jgi:hypothetical protein